MSSNATAGALSRDLADKLAKRLAGSAGLNTVRPAADAQGWPMLFISHNGAEAEGSPLVVIRIKGVDAVSKDVFGNSITAYAPHTCEIAYELAATNKPEVSTLDLITCEYQAIKMGTIIQIKEIANGTAVTEASLNAAAPSAQLEDLYWFRSSV
jgi:hypothetical protein